MEEWAEEHLSKYDRAIMLGDMNATLLDEDRDSKSCYPADRQYRAFIARARLHPLTEAKRTATYLPTRSRIDDVLAKGQGTITGHARVRDLEVGNSDHAPLLATIQTGSMQLPLTVMHTPKSHNRVRLSVPVSKEDAEALQTAADNDPLFYHHSCDLLTRPARAGRKHSHSTKL
jgi:hypothetical protein